MSFLFSTFVTTMNQNIPENRPFSLMAKPIGSVCNLNCTYCYYLEKEKLYPQDQRQTAQR